MCLLVTVLAVPTFAANISKSAQLIYNDIKITINGNAVTPLDATGNAVEAFTIDGTTYLPVRAVSSSLGMDVNWDSATKTVALTTPSELAAAPDAIYTTSHETNGYDKMLMYVKGSIQSTGALGSTESIYVSTSKGVLILVNPLKQTAWSELTVGDTYTFTFLYYSNATSPIIPAGIYLSSKNS